MPKQKTHKGLQKRVKVTASGRVKHKRAFGGHLMSGKNAKRRRRVSSPGMMNKTMAKTAKTKLCS
ncbi:MAG: 50S ribosomal protein L35 [Planctomycetota bacterium]|jgi:large subunit ribosomal protein L35